MILFHRDKTLTCVAAVFAIIHYPMSAVKHLVFKYARKKDIHFGYPFFVLLRARDGTRTRDPDLGKVVLHQLSHSRIKSAIHKHMDTILYEREFVNRKTAKSQKKFKLYMLLIQ